MDNVNLMFEIVSIVVIPGIIEALKGLKLSTKYAPIAAVVISAVLVLGAYKLGILLDVKNTFDLIATTLGISGISVLGYDIFKKISG